MKLDLKGTLLELITQHIPTRSSPCAASTSLAIFCTIVLAAPIPCAPSSNTVQLLLLLLASSASSNWAQYHVVIVSLRIKVSVSFGGCQLSYLHVFAIGGIRRPWYRQRI